MPAERRHVAYTSPDSLLIVSHGSPPSIYLSRLPPGGVPIHRELCSIRLERQQVSATMPASFSRSGLEINGMPLPKQRFVIAMTDSTWSDETALDHRGRVGDLPVLRTAVHDRRIHSRLRSAHSEHGGSLHHVFTLFSDYGPDFGALEKAVPRFGSYPRGRPERATRSKRETDGNAPSPKRAQNECLIDHSVAGRENSAVCRS